MSKSHTANEEIQAAYFKNEQKINNWEDSVDLQRAADSQADVITLLQTVEGGRREADTLSSAPEHNQWTTDHTELNRLSEINKPPGQSEPLHLKPKVWLLLGRKKHYSYTNKAGGLL